MYLCCAENEFRHICVSVIQIIFQHIKDTLIDKKYRQLKQSNSSHFLFFPVLHVLFPSFFAHNYRKSFKKWKKTNINNFKSNISFHIQPVIILLKLVNTFHGHDPLFNIRHPLIHEILWMMNWVCLRLLEASYRN